jgi:hypothetical protein
VWVFFFVSGYSLAVQFCHSRDPDALRRIALGRYLRLAIPMALTCLLLKLFFVLGWVPAVAARAANFTGSLRVEPSLLDTPRWPPSPACSRCFIWFS